MDNTQIKLQEIESKLQSAINFSKMQENNINELKSKQAFSNVKSQLEEIKTLLSRVLK